MWFDCSLLAMFALFWRFLMFGLIVLCWQWSAMKLCFCSFEGHIGKGGFPTASQLHTLDAKAAPSWHWWASSTNEKASTCEDQGGGTHASLLVSPSAKSRDKPHLLLSWQRCSIVFISALGCFHFARDWTWPKTGSILQMGQMATAAHEFQPSWDLTKFI